MPMPCHHAPKEKRAGSVDRYGAPCTTSATIARARTVRSLLRPERAAVRRSRWVPDLLLQSDWRKDAPPHVAWTDIVMSRHDQMRQRELHRNGVCRAFQPELSRADNSRRPVSIQGLQNAKRAARGSGTLIGAVDDLPCPIPSMAEWGSSTKLFRPFQRASDTRRACLRSPFIPCWTTTHWPSLVTMEPVSGSRSKPS